MKSLVNTGSKIGFNFIFDKRSDYGRDILQLAEMIGKLADEQAVYNKIDVSTALCEIEKTARMIRREWMPTPDEREEMKR